MTRRYARTDIAASVMAEIAAFRGQHNHGDGLTALDHARLHRAAMTPERRAELDAEWADAPAMKEGRCG